MKTKTASHSAESIVAMKTKRISLLALCFAGGLISTMAQPLDVPGYVSKGNGGVGMRIYAGSVASSATLFTNFLHNDMLLGSYHTGGYLQGFISVGYLQDPNRKFHIGTASDENFNASTTFVPHFTVTSGGRVGIGTSDPQRAFHVHGLEMHSSGSFGGYSFNDRAAGGGFAANPVNGARWEWYAENGFARLWSNGDKLSLDPAGNLIVLGNVTCQVLQLTSDRAVKSGFERVDEGDVLRRIASLPIFTWQFTNAPSARHMGPTAQDFDAAFGLGADDKHISVVDGIGVALAAIQGLHQQLEKKEARIAQLEEKLAGMATMASRMAEIENTLRQNWGEAASK